MVKIRRQLPILRKHAHCKINTCINTLEHRSTMCRSSSMSVQVRQKKAAVWGFSRSKQTLNLLCAIHGSSLFLAMAKWRKPSTPPISYCTWNQTPRGISQIWGETNRIEAIVLHCRGYMWRKTKLTCFRKSRNALVHQK